VEIREQRNKLERQEKMKPSERQIETCIGDRCTGWHRTFSELLFYC